MRNGRSYCSFGRSDANHSAAIRLRELSPDLWVSPFLPSSTKWGFLEDGTIETILQFWGEGLIQRLVRRSPLEWIRVLGNQRFQRPCLVFAQWIACRVDRSGRDNVQPPVTRLADHGLESRTLTHTGLCVMTSLCLLSSLFGTESSTTNRSYRNRLVISDLWSIQKISMCVHVWG